MRFAEIVIKPVSPFGTLLKGDTIFGHFCWQLVYDPDLLKKDLQEVFDGYGKAPFAVFSSAFPKVGEKEWLLPRPSLPLHFFGRENGDCFEALKNVKERKKRKWLLTENILAVRADGRLLKEGEAFELVWSTLSAEEKAVVPREQKLLLTFSQPHNSINRLTFTTGEGFAPYQTENFSYLPGLMLSIFALFDEEVMDLDTLKIAFGRMGTMGFGRDATSGLGRFLVEEVKELPLPEKSKSLYTMGPYVPAKGEYEKIWYQPFVRFGRHGSSLVFSGNPFKEPILMADEGAVINTEKEAGPYLGRAIRKVSKALPETLAQGYSIVVPFVGRS